MDTAARDLFDVIDGTGLFCHLLGDMETWWTVLGAVMPVFGIVIVGLIIRKLNWLTEEADHSLLLINVNLLFPCLILDAALGNPALSRWNNLLLAPVVGFGTVAVGMMLSLLARPLHGLSDRRTTGTFSVSTGLYNYGYVPVPLALLLFPGSETVGVMFVHNVGVEAAMWTLGVMLLNGKGLGQGRRQLLNAPLVTIVLALLVNAVGLPSHIPRPVFTGVHWLGQCAIPMALILIGAVVVDHLREFHADWGWRVIGTAVLLRIVVLPAGFLLLARYLPSSLELKRVMVLEAAMPAAVFPIVMSKHYGGDPPTALRVVIGTSIAGLVTIPLWIRFGLHWVGV